MSCECSPMPKERKQEPRRLAGLKETKNLLQRLVGVPKAELDAEERKYQAMRKRLKDKKAKRKKLD